MGPLTPSVRSLGSLALVVTGVLVTGVLGCATSGPRLSFAVEQRILRETTLDDLPEDIEQKVEEGDDVVRLLKSTGGACSGSLVGPRHVLTAAHCVVDAERARKELTVIVAEPGVLHVELGGDYLPWGRLGVRHVEVCDGYLGDLEHDVALVVLSKPVPGAVRRRAIDWEADPTGADLEMSGYGTSDKPRQVPLAGGSWPIYSTARRVRTGPAFPFTIPGVILAAADSRPGDSGGPIIDSRTGAIVSVVSRGLDPDRAKEAKSVLGDIPLTAGPHLARCRSSVEAGLRWFEKPTRAGHATD